MTATARKITLESPHRSVLLVEAITDLASLKTLYITPEITYRIKCSYHSRLRLVAVRHVAVSQFTSANALSRKRIQSPSNLLFSKY